MTSTQKESERGWFYHPPARRVEKEPVLAPPASQIPGLCDALGAIPQEPQKMYLKDTDSDYVRLAKMGGRPNLLRMRSPKPKPSEPKGYPRVDWFDHHEEDQSEQTDNDYEFCLPDYMVHQEVSKKTQEKYAPRRLPYAYDTTSVYSEDRTPTDKKVAISEPQPSGYGVRAKKQQGKSVKYKQPEVERGKAPCAQLDEGLPKITPMKIDETERSSMDKILSNEYAREWEHEREKWEHCQKKGEKREKIEISEYQSSMAAGTPPVRSATRRRSSSKKKIVS